MRMSSSAEGRSDNLLRPSPSYCGAMYTSLVVAVIILIAADASFAKHSTRCEPHCSKLLKRCEFIKGRLKFANPKVLAAFVFHKAEVIAKADKAQKKFFYRSKIDILFKKTETVDSKIFESHKSKSTESGEVNSEKYLTALAIFRCLGIDLSRRRDLRKLWWTYIVQKNICKSYIYEELCGALKYRTFDGSCNNLYHRTWGMAVTAQRRFALPPAYEDGISEPRQRDSAGNLLPSARSISNILNEGQGGLDTKPDRHFTMFFPALGQFLDHDITITPEATGEKGANIKCCKISVYRRECFPIKVPKDDKRFLTEKCLEFKRSRATIFNTCSIRGFRDQINGITAYIDASNVYGSDSKTARDLRAGAWMKETANLRLLPKAPDTECNIQTPAFFCKHAGDVRANEAPMLTMLHTCFVRQHNNIVSKLKSLNPTWNAEKLYQETRRIIIAIMQRVVYNEFLPVIIDKKLMKRYGLRGMKFVYDCETDPSIRNEFSTAAFRFGHSMVQSNQGCAKKNFITVISKPLETEFFNPYLAHTCPAGIARWASAKACKKMDSGFVKAVRDFLFLDKHGKSSDLLALNIQRGRDHGIPPYTTVRQKIGLNVPASFQDLQGLMTGRNIKRLQNAYRHVDDIDLYVGGVSEKPFGTGILGETFQTILAKQFKVLKFGDRFWYENQKTILHFSKDQLKVFKDVKLSHILCDCFKLDKLQEQVFRKVSRNNRRQKCETWATEDRLKAWKE